MGDVIQEVRQCVSGNPMIVGPCNDPNASSTISIIRVFCFFVLRAWGPAGWWNLRIVYMVDLLGKICVFFF